MNDEWQKDFEQTSKNALSVDWFISPLEYSWPDGKELFDNSFQVAREPNIGFDEMISPAIYKTSMSIDFRAKMMVFAFMRQDISKSYGLEIENGLMSLYRLDFASCISQWIYVIEGYCRKLFSVTSKKNIPFNSWKVPVTGNEETDALIKTLSTSLSRYLSGVLFKSTSNFSTQRLSRHLLLHGNVQNKSFYNQKNCLVLMFVLDALVVIEMAKNQEYPKIFTEKTGELDKIKVREHIYQHHLSNVFEDNNLIQIEMMKEHY